MNDQVGPRVSRRAVAHGRVPVEYGTRGERGGGELRGATARDGHGAQERRFDRRCGHVVAPCERAVGVRFGHIQPGRVGRRGDLVACGAERVVPEPPVSSVGAALEVRQRGLHLATAGVGVAPVRLAVQSVGEVAVHDEEDLAVRVHQLLPERRAAVARHVRAHHLGAERAGHVHEAVGGQDRPTIRVCRQHALSPRHHVVGRVQFEAEQQEVHSSGGEQGVAVHVPAGRPDRGRTGSARSNRRTWRSASSTTPRCTARPGSSRRIR